MIEKVRDALTNPETITKWGGGKAVMSEKENFEFKLWDGDIYGKNTQVIRLKKLVQDWYGGKWNKPSNATFILSKSGDSTILKLIHTDVPLKNIDEISDGWDRYYLGEIKKYLEK